LLAFHPLPYSRRLIPAKNGPALFLLFMSDSSQTSFGSPTGTDHRIELIEIVRALGTEGLLDERQLQQLESSIDSTLSSDEHALEVLARHQLRAADGRGTALDLEFLTRWLAQRAHLPYLRIDPLKIDVAQVTGVIKRSYASRFNILPVAVSGKQITIATAEPWVREWENELAKTMDLDFKRVVANPQTIRRYLGEFYAIGGSILGAQAEPASAGSGSVVAGFEQLVDLGDIDEVDPNHRHVVRIVDWLLQYAFEQRASDIHLEPRRETGNVRFRIDGVLHLVNELPARVLAAAVSRLKALGRLDVVERRRPQDGRIKTTWMWSSGGVPRTGASKPRTQPALKSSCVCRQCPPLSARSWCCESLIPRC